MPANSSSSNAPTWRREGQLTTNSQPMATNGSHDTHLHRKEKERPHDNWRAHAHPITEPLKPPNGSAAPSQPMAFSRPHDRNRVGNDMNGQGSVGSPSLLSSSLNRGKGGMLDADWVPGNHPHPDPHASHAIKPSAMGNGIIGRSPEFGTSPSKVKGNGFPTARHHWPLSSSLEKAHGIGPATHLHPLRIDPMEGSRFFPSASTPLKQNHANQPQPIQPAQPEADPNSNWMLTPTSSLPSIPSTPNHVRETSTDRSGAPANNTDGDLNGNTLRPTPIIRGPVEHFQSSFFSAPRTPSPGYNLSRQEGALSGTSLFNRGQGSNAHSSPKRSPLVASNLPQRQTAGSVTGNPVHLSPTTSPKLSHRTLSPVTRHPPVISETHSNADRVVNSIASMLNSTAQPVRPGSASRRESFTMSHSRRSSAVYSPSSPTVPTRIGVYRPPHLRNRGSVSGLKPSVAHYDRVRTPSLRGLSRSRESSISLSRPTSRPPSTVPFYHTESIPEDGQADENGRIPLRGRQSTMSIHLPDLIAEEQQRNAASAAVTATSEEEDESPYVPNTTHLLEQPIDSAALLAKLRAQLVRREAAASDAAEMDRNSVITDDNEQDFFDLSEMMEYGASEGHPLSRFGSTYAIEGRPLGDVFEVGDLLGPGLEHDGHVIKIAETTPGFVDQNEDLTGSKLEVVRKLGEGSYAVVYLVKEVSAEDAAEFATQKSMAIPSSTSKPNLSEGGHRRSDDDADLTMVASSEHLLSTTLAPSEDLLSTTLKANGNSKEDGFHNSPALEERRRKDLKINTRLRPGKEFALKCLCKRDLPEDMLEVQRLEATIHQSIPAHPNIVTLYRTYETPDWLFLVLEYCPGQDLYYWLEQAQDTGKSTRELDGDDTDKDLDKDPLASLRTKDDAHADYDNYGVLGSSLDATPPSPSLLATTSGQNLLSKRRIRLIARMFRQICDAVQFCHGRGISHRDIKPENFIVEDRRTIEEMQSACPDTSASTLVDSTRDGEDTAVIVKMTDFGLATAENHCDDFDCGSKPYMAFECHNNVSTTYDPKQADIWSLGVVLLNLLFHRSPFTEPSMSCPSFSAYCEDPIRFLMESFDGLTETVARFLSENVFCSISDDDDESQKRVSAGEFSRWACGLVDHMGLTGPGRGRMSRGASIYHTIPLIHSRTGSMSTLPSLLSSPRPRARSLARDTDHIPDLDVTADATFRAALAFARQGSLSPHPSLFTPDVLPSPTFTPLPQAPERNPFESQYGGLADLAKAPETILEREEPKDLINSDQQPRSDTSHVDPQGVRARDVFDDGQADRHEDTSDKHKNAPIVSIAQPGGISASSQDVPKASTDQDATSLYLAGRTQEDIAPNPPDTAEANDDTNPDDVVADGDAANAQEDGEKAESVTTSNHSKRRKRGARKGRTLAKQLKRSQSVEGMADVDANDPQARARERERTIRELAQASENLARQMSKMAKPSDASDGPVSPRIVLSKPTAEAAAKYNLQSMAEADADATDAAPNLATNWSSAAVRRERMSEQRKTGASVLQDSGRSRVMSWRERNQSIATISSMTSSATTTSSISSASSATSSIYSTASAPAALTRKDFSTRNRTRGSGFGLDTISEREKAAPSKKEVDAKYLAGIFGGGDAKASDKKHKETAAVRSGESRGAASVTGTQLGAPAASYEGSRLTSLVSDSNSKSNGTASLSIPGATETGQRSSIEAAAAANGAGQRSVSVSSTTSNSSSPGVAASFVSRFRRPSSSSSTNKAMSGLETDGAAKGTSRPHDTIGDKRITSASGSQLGASLGMRRDASTSTSSLHRVQDVPATKPVEAKSSNTSNTSKDYSEAASAEGNTAPAAPKKRGMGKFLLGVRDSIKNF